MILDVHVHVSALLPGHGAMSDKLLKSVPFRFMRWRLGIKGDDAGMERGVERVLTDTIDACATDGLLDAAVVLAFDAVHRDGGAIDLDDTHLYVTNDYVIELCARHPRMLFGCSVHPYRTDAVAELQRCAAAGAVLCKWLPITQAMNPADARCVPFYEALAALKLPLLCHTGGEQSLPNLDKSTADPMLLKPALDRGVTVILAHCGTRSSPWDEDFLAPCVRLLKEYEHAYADTSALNLPTRSYAYDTILKDDAVRSKLLHGSDWPILPVPPITKLGPSGAKLFRDMNWMRRDIRIKRALGFDDAYWHRAGALLHPSIRSSPKND